MWDAHLLDQAMRVLELCRQRQLRIATAESCTGGLIAALLTEIAGSSDVFERGFVTYSNAAKTELLGVDAALIVAQGAVSGAVARAMATGALARSNALLAVAVTGIAGPGGGSADKPVGLVHLAVASRANPAEFGANADLVAHLRRQFGDLGRAQVRLATVSAALDMLAAAADKKHDETKT